MTPRIVKQSEERSQIAPAAPRCITPQRALRGTSEFVRGPQNKAPENFFDRRLILGLCVMYTSVILIAACPAEMRMEGMGDRA